jgi:hypothetical protein
MPALETEEHDLNVGRDLLGDVKGTGKKRSTIIFTSVGKKW